MRFDAQRIFANDVAPVEGGYNLPNILRQAKSIVQKQTLSGIDDVGEQLLMTAEFMTTSTPKVLFKELKRAAGGLVLDPLYNEPAKPGVHGMEFERSIWVHTHATYADPEFKYDKTGTAFNQPLTVYQSLLELYMVDYFPQPGDQMIYLGRVYQLTTAFFPTNVQFLHTGVPLYVCENAEIYRQGDARVPQSINKAGTVGDQPDAATQHLRSRLSGPPGGNGPSTRRPA